MEEAFKNRVILILGVLSVILFIATVSSCNSAYRNKSARDKEMSSRLDIEEKMSRFSQEKSMLDEKLKARDKELEEQKAALQATEKALAEEQAVNESLKKELVKETARREKLEEELAAKNKSRK